MFILKSTHKLLMKIAEMEIEQRLMKRDLVVIGSQQDTIRRLTDELLILRGTVKARVEAEPEYQYPVETLSDITVSNESSDRLDKEQENLAVLRREVEKQLAALATEVDTSNITPEAMAEATNFASEEDWRRQHEPAKSD